MAPLQEDKLVELQATLQLGQEMRGKQRSLRSGGRTSDSSSRQKNRRNSMSTTGKRMTFCTRKTRRSLQTNITLRKNQSHSRQRNKTSRSRWSTTCSNTQSCSSPLTLQPTEGSRSRTGSKETSSQQTVHELRTQRPTLSTRSPQLVRRTPQTPMTAEKTSTTSSETSTISQTPTPTWQPSV